MPQEGRIKPWYSCFLSSRSAVYHVGHTAHMSALKLQLLNRFNAKIKPYCGETTYRLNDDGLIFEHLETWDVRHFAVRDAAVHCRFDKTRPLPVPQLHLQSNNE